MSILLDALRKSEEQRRLGTTPTLQTPETSVDLNVGEQRYWIPAVMMMLAAASITWMGFAQFDRPEPIVVVESSSSASPIAPLPTDVPLQADTTQEVLNSLAKSPELPPATTPVMDFTAEPESTSPEDVQANDAPRDPSSRNIRSVRPRVIASSGAGEKAGDEAGEAATPGTAAHEEPIAALVEDLSGSDVAARPDSDELQPYAAEPISYWQIPQSLRDNMPEMRITVLVYAENPQDRFLLINGKRLREKEEVSDGVVVEEIQRDRAIFTFRDYRFQVKS